jgi:erythromycin esterase-like protein
VTDADKYYRALFRGGAASWNLRDRRMAGTIETWRAHLSEPDRPAKLAVWAYNSHLGDARATQMCLLETTVDWALPEVPETFPSGV